MPLNICIEGMVTGPLTHDTKETARREASNNGDEPEKVLISFSTSNMTSDPILNQGLLGLWPRLQKELGY